MLSVIQQTGELTLEDMIKQYQNGDNSMIETIWNTLSSYYKSKAARFYLRHSLACQKAGVEFDDLFYHAGFSAMLESILTYNAETGVPAVAFLHYALRTEFAKLCGYQTGKHDLLNDAESLDALIPGTEDLTLEDSVPDARSLDFVTSSDMFDDAEVVHQELSRVLDDQRQLDTIQRYYFGGETLQSIADAVGVSAEMVRQRKNAAERKLSESPVLLELYKEMTGLHAVRCKSGKRWRNCVYV